MLYTKYLKTLKKCPFCELEKSEIIKQNKHAILTLAKAPYTKDHLLVLPKKHVFKLNDLTKQEKDALEALEYYALKNFIKNTKMLVFFIGKEIKNKLENQLTICIIILYLICR